MALRKTTKSSTTASKAGAPAPTAPRASRQASATGDQNRLLREAAWSRMFGRVESKNPFAR